MSILYNDQIYFACANYLYALSADDGSLKWKYKLTNEGVDITKIITINRLKSGY